MRFNQRLILIALLGLLGVARLCHVGILWAEETLPLAAARQMLDGKLLYRDIWFDKPPLVAAPYLLWGARDGWPLRLAGSLYLLIVCWLAYCLARELWSEREGFWAAGLLGFFLTFDFPSAVIPLASDLLLVAPHLGALWFAWKRKPAWSGVFLGIGFLISPKALLVAAVCVFWNPSGVVPLGAGFLAVSAITTLGLATAGALPGWWDQVWRWGRVYASASLGQEPFRNGLIRTIDWAGFHVPLLASAGWFFARSQRQEKQPSPLQWAAWVGFSVAGVIAGWRFFPRYYFLLLPVLVVAAARGFTLLGRKGIWFALLLLVPLLRFGPRYIELPAGSAGWSDTAMDHDSRGAAALIRLLARTGDTLFVWGFRPELYVYTALPAATRFLDSQPLTGVPADRHLADSTPTETLAPAKRRAELVRSSPTFIVDGLGLYNPRLAIAAYPDLHDWLARYREVARSGHSIIYRMSE